MCTPKQVHMPDGFTPVGARKIRAHCTCGYSTTPRVDEGRAAEALDVEHGSTESVCALCGRDRAKGLPWSRRFERVRLLVDDQTGDQLLVCRGEEDTCRALAAQHQVQLDRAALGAQTPRPTLRVVR